MQKKKNLLRTLRVLAGISQEQLARSAGVSQSSISRAEAGKRKLMDDEKQKLSQFFSVDSESLIR